jgi:hypothetical protein
MLEKFIDFPPRISSHTSFRFSHGPNHRLYGFGSRDSGLEPRYFGVDPHSHRGVHPQRRYGFSARGVVTSQNFYFGI